MQENEKKNERNNQRAEDLGCELMQSEEKKPKPHSQKSESKSSSPDNLKVRVSQDGACACAVLFLMLLLLLLVSGYETIGCLGGALFFGVLLIMCAVDVSPRKLRGD